MKRNIDLGLLVIRLSIGVLMLFHGVAKLTKSLTPIMEMLASKEVPGFVAYGVYFGEIIAPLFIIIGYRTRLAAAVLGFNMFMILFVVKPQILFSLSDNGGWKPELAGLYFAGAIALLFSGAGKYAFSKNHFLD